MKYQDLLLIASEIGTTKDADGKTLTTFRLSIPFVWQEPVPRSFERKALKAVLNAATSTTAAWEDALALGRTLADILLPNEAQQVLRERLTQAQAQGTGLRLRLCLPAELQRLPWEFIALNRAGGEFTVNDFLALHPHCSIVRQPATTLPQWDVQPDALEKVNLLVALAGPEDQPVLDLERERATLAQILDPFSESLQPEWAMHATPEDLLSTEALAHVFHFAGHGVYVKEAMSESPSKADGKGYLVLENEEHESTLLAGDVLGVALRKRGVRVAVLGACHSAAGDDLHQWSGVSEALLKAELGAVVGMQFAVRDDSAIAFTSALYRALLAGMTIDEAVQSGRVMLAAGKGDARGALTPVLYLCAGDGVVFPEMAGKPATQSAQTQIAKQTTADRSAASAIRIGKIDARYSQGMIVGNTGSVTQHFGDKIDTGGSAYIRGNVNAGGDFVGRDKIVISFGSSPSDDAWLAGMTPDQKTQSQRLQKVLGGFWFSMDDLEDLCATLELDWDNLRGEVKSAKARAMIHECFKAGRLDELYAMVKTARPNAGL